MKKVLAILLSIVFALLSMSLVIYAFDTADVQGSIYNYNSLKANMLPINPGSDQEEEVYPDLDDIIYTTVDLTVTSRRNASNNIEVTVSLPTTISDNVSSGNITITYEGAFMTFASVSGTAFGRPINTTATANNYATFVSHAPDSSGKGRVVVSVAPQAANIYSLVTTFTIVFTPAKGLTETSKSQIDVAGSANKVETVSDLATQYTFVLEKGKGMFIAYCTHPTTETLVTIASTCRAEGIKTTYCSVCGLKVGDSFIPKTDHTFSDTPAFVKKAPTCTASGLGEFVCTVCSQTATLSIPATGHQWGTPILINGVYYVTCTIHNDVTKVADKQCAHADSAYLVDRVITASTCTSTGLADLKCSLCGSMMYNQVTPKTEHTWTDYEIITEATDYQNGIKLQVCSVCKTSRYTDYSKNEHTSHSFNGVETIISAPTCTEKGQKRVNCTGCEEFIYVDIAPLGHEYGEWTTVKAATCTETGTEQQTCIRCTVSQTREVAALGHDYGEWVVTKEATCTENGEKTKKCSRCDSTQTESIEALGHTWSEWSVVEEGSCTEPKVEKRSCSVCGLEETKSEGGNGHKWSATTVMQNPTCDVDGYGMRMCPVCGTIEKVDMPALGHIYGEWSIESMPTCTEDGVQARTCSRCGGKDTKSIPALGHNFGEWTTRVEVTCTDDGEEIQTCTRCGQIESRVTKAIGHDYGEWELTIVPTCTTDGKTVKTCKNCGDEIEEIITALGHDISPEWTRTKEPTCTEDGEEVKTCSRCDYKEIQTLDALGHDFGEWTVAKESTCTEEGKETRTCARCGEVEEQEIPMIEHNFGEWKIVQQGNCTTDEVKVRQCLVCIYSETERTTAPGHDWNDWVTISTLSCTEDEVKERTCKVCNEVENEVVAVHEGHKFSQWEVRSVASCTIEGLEVRVCSACGLEERNETEKLPHVYDEVNGYKVIKAATCSSTGEEECICSTCGIASIKRTIQIDVNAHEWTEWSTKKIATCLTGGTETRTCKLCAKTESRDTEVTGHTFGPSETVKNGTQKTCSVCKTVETILTIKDVTSKQESNDIFTLTFKNSNDVNGTIVYHTSKLSSEEYSANVQPAENSLKEQGQTVIGAYKHTLTINGKEAGVDSANEITITLPDEYSSTDVKVWYRSSTGLSPLSKDSYSRSKNVITINVSDSTFSSKTNILVLTNAGKYSQINIAVPITIAVVTVVVVVGLVLFLRNKDSKHKVDEDEEQYSSTDK